MKSLLWLLMLLALWGCNAPTPPVVDVATMQAETFSQLEQVRTQKRDKLLRYLRAQQGAAAELAEQPSIISAFKGLHREYRSKHIDSAAWQQLEQQLELHFVTRLGAFYDLLLVDTLGEIFFTLRRENDFAHNIKAPMFQGLGLHRALATPPDTLRFVDFEHYRVSAEPASFYLVPLFDGQQRLGTAVLQLPANQLNLYLSDRRKLGRSGEVYLVNQRQMMMTQSRFIDDVTVLKKQIDTEAVRDLNGSGRKMIRDYRGEWVYSAYERLNYEGVEWLLIAERDEQEVLSDYLAQHLDTLLPGLIENLPLPEAQAVTTEWPAAQRVDFKELRKSREQPLLTRGVATCTALAAWRPGHFAYLAHISPTDAIYISNDKTRNSLGDEYSDFLGTLLAQVTHYDIIPYQRSELRFVLAANHHNGFRLALKRLLDEGVMLNQIRLLYAPTASSLELLIAPSGEGAVRYQPHGVVQEIKLHRLPDLATLLIRQLGYSRER